MSENGNVAGVVQTDKYGKRSEVFPLSTDEAFLLGLLKDVFENHWQNIVFGPLIQGAAYELRCTAPPHGIALLDGYLTIHFGRSHFHLCIGENKGSSRSPTPPELRAHRRTRRAELFRGLDRAGAPVNWGLRLVNGAGEEQMTVFFPNPFLSDDDGILSEPDWTRLAMWEDFGRRYLNREPDGKDRMGRGFAHG